MPTRQSKVLIMAILLLCSFGCTTVYGPAVDQQYLNKAVDYAINTNVPWPIKYSGKKIFVETECDSFCPQALYNAVLKNMEVKRAFSVKEADIIMVACGRLLSGYEQKTSSLLWLTITTHKLTRFKLICNLYDASKGTLLENITTGAQMDLPTTNLLGIFHLDDKAVFSLLPNPDPWEDINSDQVREPQELGQK